MSERTTKVILAEDELLKEIDAMLASVELPSQDECDKNRKAFSDMLGIHEMDVLFPKEWQQLVAIDLYLEDKLTTPIHKRAYQWNKRMLSRYAEDNQYDYDETRRRIRERQQ